MSVSHTRGAERIIVLINSICVLGNFSICTGITINVINCTIFQLLSLSGGWSWWCYVCILIRLGRLCTTIWHLIDDSSYHVSYPPTYSRLVPPATHSHQYNCGAPQSPFKGCPHIVVTRSGRKSGQCPREVQWRSLSSVRRVMVVAVLAGKSLPAITTSHKSWQMSVAEQLVLTPAQPVLPHWWWLTMFMLRCEVDITSHRLSLAELGALWRIVAEIWQTLGWFREGNN